VVSGAALHVRTDGPTAGPTAPPGRYPVGVTGAANSGDRLSDPTPADAPLRSTVADRVAELIGGEPTLTMIDLAEQAGVDLAAARLFWRAMGFPNVADDAVTFTPRDVERSEERRVGKECRGRGWACMIE